MKEGAHVKEKDSLFLDKPLEASDEPPNVTRKLAPNIRGAYGVLFAYKDTIAIVVNGLRDVVSRDRVTSFTYCTPEGSPTEAQPERSSGGHVPTTAQETTIAPTKLSVTLLG